MADVLSRVRADMDRVREPLAGTLLAQAADEIAYLRRKLNFLIEEIIDREGREGMTDYDFAEQVIALAQRTREELLALSSEEQTK